MTPKNAKQAVALALQGHTDDALAKLVELSRECADALAAESALGILAFRGEWRGVIEHAEVFLRDVTVIGACNVFDDVRALLKRAGRETGEWTDIAHAIKQVPNSATHYRTDVSRFLRTMKEPDVRAEPTRTKAELDAYRDAAAKAPALKRFANKPAALHRHLMALAIAFDVDDDIVKAFDAHRDDMEFQHAVAAACVHAKRERESRAWIVLKEKLPTWYGGFVCSVAPVELLIDPVLAPIMTPARCAKVLATPRSMR